MKVNFFFYIGILVGTFHAAGHSGYGQSLNRRVKIEMRNESLSSLFNKIKEETGLSFVFPNDEVDRYPDISLPYADRSIKEILDLVLKEKNLSYRLKGNTVFISVNQRKKKVEEEKESEKDRKAGQRAREGSQQEASTAQQSAIHTVTGIVKDESTQETLAGANIIVKGTTRGTTTDAEGKFSIDAEDNDILVFSFIGFTPQEVPVSGRETIEVLLTPDRNQLQEVIVVGYGTQKQASVTSAVSQIQGEELTRRPVSNVQQSLQGLVPGVTVLDRGGPPGRSAATIRVRGITTFNIDNPAQFSTYGGFDLAKNDALVIIDGIEQRLTDINPDDIESISVLKDASSTAIYGSRATNGVILITTKRAKENGNVTVNYHGYYGIQESINQPRMMGLEAYMRMQVAAYTNSGAALPARLTEESIQTWVTATDRELYPLPNTWFETVLSPAPQQNHSLSVAGGNEVIRARLSGRFMDQDGLAPNFNDKLSEFKLNTDIRASKKITFSADINYRVNNSEVPTVDPFQNILHGSLWAVPKYADGTYGLSSQGNNPLMYAEIGGVSGLNNEFLIASGKAEMEIVDGLKFSTQFGARAHNTNAKNFANAYTNRDKNSGITKTVANNSLTEVRNTLREYTWNNILTYDKIFADKHETRFLAGYSEINNIQTFLSASRERFYNNDIQSIDQGTNDATKNNAGRDAEFGLRSFFGRVNYAFDGKYLVEVNGRYDGSSKFTGNKRFSFFPSFSAGWRLSQENFWRGLDNITDDVKIRGSWGRTGNQSVELYSYYAALSLSTYTFGGVPVQGYRQATLANTDLGWETTTQTNIGLDMSFVDSRLTLSMDYYKKVTDDILLNLGIPATVGLNAPPQNAGSVENKGFELLLGYRGKNQTDFRYSASANFSINNNKVIDLKGTGPYIYGSGGSGDNYPRYTIAEGLPINTLWGYKTDGIFQTQEEIDNYPTYATNSRPGDVKYLDLNNDQRIDANDMTALGYTFPKYTFGLSTDFAFKNFELNILFQGAADVDTRLGGALSDHGNFEAFAHEILTDNYWTPENPGARFPRPLKFDFRNNITSDRTVLDGSYLRVKNIQLAYKLPVTLIQRAKLNMVRFYISGTNLITFSRLNEWNLDPEVEPGVAVYYPQVSLYTLGVNVQF